MRRSFLYILSILLTFGFTGCTDDFVQTNGNETGDGSEHVYTLQLAIDDSPASRSLTSADVGGGFKTRWCEGDKVILTLNRPNTVNTPETYEFVFSGYSDPNGRVANFTYSGTAIRYIKKFIGTLTYSCGIDREEVTSRGYTIRNNDFKAIVNLKCKPYALQKSNDNAEHLKCLDNLSHTFTEETNLNGQVIPMRRQFSVIKIVLDDIYYPIYGGAVLCVKGLKFPDGDNTDEAVGMVLGDGIVGNEGSGLPYIATTNVDISCFRATNLQNPTADHGISPFYEAPTSTDPTTGYAVRDDNHKLVVYLPIFEEREIRENEKVSICLRDSWSLDYYFWQTDNLKPCKLPLGSVYTIDLTQKIGGKYRFESTAAINLGYDFTYRFGTMFTKNIGAKNFTDAGDYYMFGQDQPIKPGGYYPDKKTSYYYYKDGKVWYYNQGEPKSIAVVTNNFSGTSGLVLPDGTTTGKTQTVNEWWAKWLKPLDEYPKFGMDIVLPGNTGTDAFHSTEYATNEVIPSDGNPVGVRLTCKRTGHSVVIPVSGVLEPSAKFVDNNIQYITPDAVANIKEGTEKHAVFTGQNIITDATSNTIRLSTYSYQIGNDNTTINRQRINYELDMAVPIRPSLYEPDDKFKNLLKAIPGN